MGTELATIYTSGPSEYTDLLAGTLDMTDWPCGPTTTCPTVNTGTSTLITTSVPVVSYFEIQYHLGNDFWGVNMNFGNNPNGTEIRQGIAHMIDKTIFTTNEQNCIGTCIPIDNPLPPSIGGNLPGANPCEWDVTAFVQNGCTVGSAGGTAYHLASATGADGFAWLQAPGSTDLNAAAQHFQNALRSDPGCSGVTFSTTTSILSIPVGCTSPTATGHVPTFFIRSDDVSRNDLGNSLAAQICYIFTGAYTTPCAFLNTVPGPITAFPGFQTNPTGENLNWWLYTAGYIGGTFFDSSLYLTYNSHFVDSYDCTGQPGCNAANPFPLAQANGGPCSNGAVATASAADYIYLCNSSYDAVSTQMEFAPCLTAPGDPFVGEIIPTYGACPNTGADSIVNATTSTYTGQPVLYGPTPPIGSILTVVPTSIFATASCDAKNDAAGALGVADGIVAGPLARGTLICFSESNPLSSVYTPLSNPTPPPALTCNAGDQPALFQDGVLKGKTLCLKAGYLTSNRGAWNIELGHPVTCVVVDGCITLLYGPGSPDGDFLLPPPSYVECFCAVSGTFNPGKLSGISAGVQSEDRYGMGAYTLPFYTEKDQFGYLNDGWIRAINSATAGLPNFYTWLNAWNPSPVQANTIHQGFAQQTKSLSPYIASTVWDFYVVANIYDSLYAANPLSPTQLMNWMTISTNQEANSQLTYTPPTGTVTTYRFTLIPGLTFQDGTPVTSFDVAFSYLSLLGTGAFQSGAASSVAGITILGPHQFDFNINSVGPFTLTDITGLTVMPGKDWTAAVSSWNTGISTCTGASSASCYPVQYGLAGSPLAVTCVLAGCGSFAASNMQWATTKIGASFDPIKGGVLVGSSGWQCGSGSGLGGASCSSTGAQNPGPKQSYTLTAYPNYVHSSSALSLWIWAADGSATGPSLTTYSTAAGCYLTINTPVGIDASVPPATAPFQGCSHWQQGIGGPTESTSATASDHVVAPSTLGTAVIGDPKLVFTGPTPFGSGDTIVYNVNGGTTFTAGDTVIGCVSATTCTPTTPAVGTTLNSDALLKFRDFPATGVWSNGKSVVYDSDNSGGYDWGDVSSSPNSNSAGLFITTASGISIPPPPPGGCPAVGVAGTTATGCWLPEGSTQVGIVALRIGYNWLNPFNWVSSPPLGIGSFPPVLYQPNSPVVLNPNNIVLCNSSFNATSTNSGSTVGGYDC